MEKVIRIGMDTSKSVFQLHGVNAAEQVVLRIPVGSTIYEFPLSFNHEN